MIKCDSIWFTVSSATPTTIIKLVPGAGTVTGFAIKAGVASSVTLAMGYAWMAVNERLVAMSESEAAAFLDSDQVRTAFLEAFNSAWKNRKRLGREIDDET